MNTPRIAVTGLHRGENPQPGASIIRSIRRRFPDAHITGLVYDALESGIYVDGGPDAVFTMPYPTSGVRPFLERLDEVLKHSPVDIFIPTLDAEVELLVHLEDELALRGLRTLMPDRMMLQRRAKNHLPKLAEESNVSVPDTEAVFDANAALRVAEQFGFPVMVKGQYYDAKLVHNPGELVDAVTSLLSQWGAPAIVQRCVSGTEFNAMGVGDGRGGMIGLCCVRKTIISDKGKGQGAITVRDCLLEGLAANLIAELKWRGPFEIEVMKDADSGEFLLIEINPRFPAWVDFPSSFGLNFPAALVEMIRNPAARVAVPPSPAGHFYVRHFVEVHGQIDQLAALSSDGQLASEDITLASSISNSRIIAA